VTTIKQNSRLYFIDWLRVFAVLGMVIYHVGMLYVPWNFHVKSSHIEPGLVPWMLWLNPWRMNLLFVISGVVTSQLLLGGASTDLIRSRSARLLWPLLCAVLVIVPAQAYYEVKQKYGFTGDFWRFLAHYFTAYKGFCDAKGCLILPTWNHAWFLPYVWSYTMLIWTVVKIGPTSLDRLSVRMAHWLNGLGLLFVPIGFLFLIRMSLFDRFPVFQDLIHDWYSHSIYFAMFMFGALCSRQPRFWSTFERLRWPTFILGTTSWCLIILNPLWFTKTVWHLMYSVQMWCLMAATLGFGYRYLNRDYRWLAYLNDAVFPLYLFHQTYIIVFHSWLTPIDLPPGAEGPLLMVAAVFASIVSIELIKRFPLMNNRARKWIGLKLLA
jgi:glucans biosynthesis protein C